MKNLIIAILMMALGICPCYGQQQAKSSTKVASATTSASSSFQKSEKKIVPNLLTNPEKDGSKKVVQVYTGSRGGLYYKVTRVRGEHKGEEAFESLVKVFSDSAKYQAFKEAHKAEIARVK